MKKIIFVLLVLFILVGCGGKNDELIGTWSNDELAQTLVIKKGNTAIVDYGDGAYNSFTWKLDGDTLILETLISGMSFSYTFEYKDGRLIPEPPYIWEQPLSKQ